MREKIIKFLFMIKSLIKLHLGCWKRNIPGFTNVDICDLPHVHHRRSAEDLSVFPTNSAELIYASHVFEYFDRQEAEKVLREWHRVLVPGGTLRIAVPDFEAITRVYLKYKKNLFSYLQTNLPIKSTAIWKKFLVRSMAAWLSRQKKAKKSFIIKPFTISNL